MSKKLKEVKIEIPEEEEPEVKIELEETRLECQFLNWLNSLSDEEKQRIREKQLRPKVRKEELRQRLEFLKRKDQDFDDIVEEALTQHFTTFFKLPPKKLAPILMDITMKKIESKLKAFSKRLGLQRTVKSVFGADIKSDWKLSFNEALQLDWKTLQTELNEFCKQIENAILHISSGKNIANALNMVKESTVSVESSLLDRMLDVKRKYQLEHLTDRSWFIERLREIQSDVKGSIHYAREIEELIREYRKIETEK